ncbi:hypothetical protein Hanom_Chr04g00375971 [Helianthus anomalus]
MLVCHRFRLKLLIGRLLLVYTILRGLGSDDYTMIEVRRYLMFNRSSVICNLHLADTDFISSPLKTSLSRLIPPFFAFDEEKHVEPLADVVSQTLHIPKITSDDILAIIANVTHIESLIGKRTATSK